MVCEVSWDCASTGLVVGAGRFADTIGRVELGHAWEEAHLNVVDDFVEPHDGACRSLDLRKLDVAQVEEGPGAWEHDLHDFRLGEIEAARPDVVFNIVERTVRRELVVVDGVAAHEELGRRPAQTAVAAHPGWPNELLVG